MTYELTPIQLLRKLHSINQQSGLIVVNPVTHTEAFHTVLAFYGYPLDVKPYLYYRFGKFNQYNTTIGQYHDRGTYPGSDTFVLSCNNLPHIKEL